MIARRIFPTSADIASDLAPRLLARIDAARTAGKQFLLGCPTGRTPRPIFDAIAHRLAETKQDVSNVVIVMMDEYLVHRGGELGYADATRPWSCHRFARSEIVDKLNAALPVAHRIPGESIWFPDPREPASYDARIADAGGIDFFMLASGARDGHVAFNPPGSTRDSVTRVIRLSEETRRDNLETFPTFGSLDAVPMHGVSVGIATIAAAREAAMIVWGAGKRVTLERMLRAKAYDAAWPATVIHECAVGEILADAEASGTSP